MEIFGGAMAPLAPTALTSYRVNVTYFRIKVNKTYLNELLMQILKLINLK